MSDGKISKENNEYYSLRLKNGMGLLLRTYPSSDAKVLLQVWGVKEYKAVSGALRMTDIGDKGDNPIRIIDAGANVGYTTAFFLNMYPNADIFSIEPSGLNFCILKKNISNNNFSTVTLEMAALWHKKAKLQVDQSSGGGNEWAFTVSENDNGDVNSVCIPEILERMQWDYIDILKIDIEGSERCLFNDTIDKSWLEKTKVLAIEIHSTGDLRNQICTILRDKNFNLFDSGELTIAYKNVL